MIEAVEFRCCHGSGVTPYLADVARLRSEVFAEWPYLYAGSESYERRYLERYARSAHSVFVLALLDEQVIGAATGMPLADEDAVFRQPFEAAGIAPHSVFYFGESVLLPAWRGRGIGHRFFDGREAAARELGGVRYTAFCAVQRPSDHPRRPSGYRPLDPFWHARGYRPRPDLESEVEWAETPDGPDLSHRLRFWLKDWQAGIG